MANATNATANAATDGTYNATTSPKDGPQNLLILQANGTLFS